jgi:hypothetical protein
MKGSPELMRTSSLPLSFVFTIAKFDFGPEAKKLTSLSAQVIE